MSAITESQGDSRPKRLLGPGAWRFVDAGIAALLAGPVEALLLFLLSPDRPLTLRDFLATLVALSPQIVLVFVLLGPIVVWLGRLLSVARTTRRGISARYVLRFLFVDLLLLTTAAIEQTRAVSTLLAEPGRSALMLTATSLAVSTAACAVLIWRDARGFRGVVAWTVAIATALSVALLVAAELRRVKIERPEPEWLPGFEASRAALVIDWPGLGLRDLDAYAEGGQAPTLEALAGRGLAARIDGGLLDDQLVRHASLITGAAPRRHGLLGSARYQPLGDRRSFAILPEALALGPLLETPLWRTVPIDHSSVRAIGLPGVAQALGWRVSMIGDPLAYEPAAGVPMFSVPGRELYPGRRWNVPGSGSVVCADPGDLSDQFFDPPAAELDSFDPSRRTLREALAHDLCAIELARHAFEKSGLTYVRLTGHSQVAEWFAGYREHDPARGTSHQEIEAYGRTLSRYVRRIDRELRELVAKAGPDALVVVVSSHAVASRQDLGRLFGSFVSMHQPSARPAAGQPGLWIVAGEGVRTAERLDRMVDVTSVLPTVLWAVGLPSAEDMGGVVHLAFEASYVDRHPLISVPSFGRRSGPTGPVSNPGRE